MLGKKGQAGATKREADIVDLSERRYSVLGSEIFRAIMKAHSDWRVFDRTREGFDELGAVDLASRVLSVLQGAVDAQEGTHPELLSLQS